VKRRNLTEQQLLVAQYRCQAWPEGVLKRAGLAEVEDVARSRQRAAACERAIFDIYAEIKPEEVGWLMRFAAACASPEVLSRHGITAEQLQEEVNRN